MLIGVIFFKHFFAGSPLLIDMIFLSAVSLTSKLSDSTMEYSTFSGSNAKALYFRFLKAIDWISSDCNLILWIMLKMYICWLWSLLSLYCIHFNNELDSMVKPFFYFCRISSEHLWSTDTSVVYIMSTTMHDSMVLSSRLQTLG